MGRSESNPQKRENKNKNLTQIIIAIYKESKRTEGVCVHPKNIENNLNKEQIKMEIQNKS